MPNWTYNIIRASGSKESLDAFLAKTTKVNNSAMYDDERLSFDFESIIPMPDNIFRGNIGNQEKEHCKANNIPNWYDWSVENWGTKWNACDSVIERESDTFVRLMFSTAWSYPIPVMEKMFDMFPDIEFIVEAEEESEAFALMHTRDDGIIEGTFSYMVDDKVVEYDPKREQWVDNKGNGYEDYDRREIFY
jgi:hypothetical protein